MFLETNDIDDEPVAFDHTLDLAELIENDTSLLSVRDVRLAGRAGRGERGVDLQGQLTATAVLACGRCLETYETAISEDFFLTAVVGTVDLGGGEFEVKEEDAELLFVEDGRVDLREIAREQIYLGLPLKAVCHAGCKGLCPTCGANRNRVECGCRSQALDPRLAPLLDLKKKMGDS